MSGSPGTGRRAPGAPVRAVTSAALALAALLAAPIVPVATTVGALSAQAVAPGEQADRDASTRRIEGRVTARPADGGRALPWAMVEVDGVGRVLADSAGLYRVPGVEPGLVRVVVSHVGFSPAEVEVLVPRTGIVAVDVELTREVLALPGIVVSTPSLVVSEPGARSVADEAVRALVGLRSLGVSPGITETGLADAIPGGDGSGQAPGRGDALYLRGSAADLKLVLLDGAPVYTPFHLGGLLPSFDATALGSARHHVGGAPARYDGGLSYILDLRTRAPRRDRVHTSGWADLMSVGGSLEVPLGEGAGVLVSARRLHGLGGTLAGGEGSPYGYGDVLGHLEGDVGDGSYFVTGFANRESVFLDFSAGEHPPGESVAAEDDAAWGNAALSAGWSGAVDDWRVDIGGSASRYTAELPVHDDLGGPEGPPDVRTLLATGRTERSRLTVDAMRPGEHGPTAFGLSLDHMELGYGARGSVLIDGAYRVDGDGYVLGGYFEETRRLVPGLSLRWGARLDRFVLNAGRAAGTETSLRGALRLAVLWDLGGDALLTLAGGRYHQLARRGDVDVTLASADPLQVGTGAVSESSYRAGPALSVATADHLVASLEQRIGDDVVLETELFYKSFDDVAGVEAGSLTSSGIDLQVLRRGERLTGSLGYSLAWFWEGAALGGVTEFSGRHLLNVGVRSALVGPAWLDLRVSFSDGLPLTSVPFGDRLSDPAQDDDFQGEVDAGRLDVPRPSGGADGFLRVDAELFAQWDTSVGPFHGHLRPYLKVLNALDRRDALFYYFEPWRSDELRPLAELSLVPVVGLEWRF